MTDKELKKLVASLAVESKKTDEQINELKTTQIKTDEQLRQTDEQLRHTDNSLKQADERLTKKLDKLAKMIGSIGNNQGDVAEEYFINSLKDKLSVAGMEFDYLIPNYIIKGKDIKDEFDILLVNGNQAAIIEVKYKFHKNDLDKLPKKIKNLKKLPQYKNYKVYAGIAAFKIDDSTIKEATSRGYFVLQRVGDVIESFVDELKVA